VPDRITLPDGMSDPRRHGSEITSSVSIQSDEGGFFGRECPEQDCLAYFKLHGDEYHLAKQTGLLSCPSCGIRANHETFMTPEQVQRSNAAMRELAQATAHQLLRDAFKGFKSRPGSGVSLTFKPGPPHRPRALPTYVERETVRTFTCPAGGHRAVIYDRLVACPYCGPDTPPRAVLDDNLAVLPHLLGSLEHLPAKDKAEVKALGGEPAMAERTLTGAVAAIQSFAKDLHAGIGKPVTVWNPWQSPTRLAEQWQASFGADPFAGLTPEQHKVVRLGFARRHILEHNGGKADERYLAESGDTVALGRPVRYGAAFVRDFIDAVGVLADELESGVTAAPENPRRAPLTGLSFRKSRSSASEPGAPEVVHP
jgi:hypothetical protein